MDNGNQHNLKLSSEKKEEPVVLSQQEAIEILKTLEGLKRKLQARLKRD